MLKRLVPDALVPRLLFRAVEDDEVPLVYRPDKIHIIRCLLQAFLYSPLKAVALDFQFEHNALNGPAVAICQGFSDKQIGAFAP